MHDPLPTSEVVLQDVEVLWDEAPSPLLLFESAPVGEEVPDGEHVLGGGPLGAFSVEDDGILASH